MKGGILGWLLFIFIVLPVLLALFFGASFLGFLNAAWGNVVEEAVEQSFEATGIDSETGLLGDPLEGIEVGSDPVPPAPEL